MVSARGESDEQRSRRTLLLAGMGAGLGLAGASLLAVAAELKPRVKISFADKPAQQGDRLVYAQGAHQRQIIAAADVPTGGPLVLAWPMDPKNETIRNANPHNVILLVRAAADSWFTDAERKHTAARVAAYAATCTHLCCTVSDWVPRPQGGDPHGYLVCPCHRSHFDPWDGARVLSGPAPRPLPILPIELGPKGELVVRSGFLTTVGCQA